jgi:hypothetical protein
VFHLVLVDSEFSRLTIACMMSPCVVFIGRGCEAVAAAAGGTSRKENKNKNGSSSRRRKKPWLAQGPYLLSTMDIPQFLASRLINCLASFPPQSQQTSTSSNNTS